MKFSKKQKTILALTVAVVTVVLTTAKAETYPVFKDRDAIGTVVVKDREYNLFLLGGERALRQIKIFNDLAIEKKMPNHISKCDRVIELPVGVARGNHSYGGICTLDSGPQPEKVMVCSDEMLGRLKTKSVDADTEPDTQYLIGFVIDNCYGG